MHSSFKLIFLLVFGCFLFVQCRSKSVVQDEPSPIKEAIQYDQSTLLYFVDNKNFGEVLDIAKEQNKITYVEFYTDWCLPCKIMHETLYMNKVIANFYNSQFVNYKMNAGIADGADMAFLYQVEEFPTLLFLDHKGSVISRHTGGISGTQLMVMGEDALVSFDSLQVIKE